MLDNYLVSLEQAISVRRSRRAFVEDMSPEHQQKLDLFINNLTAPKFKPFTHDVEIKIDWLKDVKDAVYFRGTHSIASFISSSGMISRAQAGFIGELFILYATNIGLDTCWYGHFKKDIYRDVLGIDKKQAAKVIWSITPLGIAKEKIGFQDRLFRERRRKTVQERLHHDSLTKFSDDIMESLTLACLAPSAMNSQFWEFHISKTDEGKDKVTIAKPMGYKHIKWEFPDIDIGCCAAHFYVAMHNRGHKTQINITEEYDRAIWEFIID